MEPNTEAGYKVDSLENYGERYKCFFCRCIMRSPVQLTDCGHRFCQTCLDIHRPPEADGYIVCPFQNCNTKNKRSQIRLDKAFKREVDSLEVKCMYRTEDNCEWSGFLRDYQSHITEKHSQFTCDLCREIFNSRQDFVEHQRSTCPAIFCRCPLNPACGLEMIKIEQYLSHLLDPKHQEAIVQALTGQYKINLPPSEEDSMESNDEEHKIREIVTRKLEELDNQIKSSVNSTATLVNQCEEAKRNLEQSVSEMQTILNKINESRLSIINRQENQRNLQIKIDELSDTVNNFEPIATNGSLIWKIKNVSDVIADAQAERCKSIMSPIFYSSPNGYKLQLRLFPFGDGNAHRTHMSLFIMILKGEYDPILVWPFKHRITFCLLDQTGSKHIVDSFQPDVKSSSFQRPKTSANTPNGIPKFVLLSTVQADNNEYVREDTMFIQVFLDMSGNLIPTPAWLMRLNCALPLHLQESLMQRESSSFPQASTLG